MDSPWLKQFLLKLTGEYIDRVFQSKAMSEWEVESLKAAVDSQMISTDNGVLVLPDGRKWSLLTLNREYLTHLAIYFELINSGRFHADDIKLEHLHMDLVVFKGEQPHIAVEVKKSELEASRLIAGMQQICANPPLEERDRGNDPLRKIKCLLKMRASHFWVISPERRWQFSVHYQNRGLTLIEESQHKAA